MRYDSILRAVVRQMQAVKMQVSSEVMDFSLSLAISRHRPGRAKVHLTIYRQGRTLESCPLNRLD